MTQSIATAADYADAMLVARRARSWLFGILLFMLLLQIGLFFTARYTNILTHSEASTASAADSTPTLDQLRARHGLQLMQYLIGLSDFLGIAVVVVMASLLYLLLKIMLVGRLIGVSHVTRAYIWCLILAVLIFPWQAFLNHQNFSSDIRIPGVLYTWNELVHLARFSSANTQDAILKWARFVVFPAVAVVILFSVQIGSSRGLRKALGEEAAAPAGDFGEHPGSAPDLPPV